MSAQQGLAVDDEQHREKDDDRHVHCACPPLVGVVGGEEASDAHDVEDDGDDADQHSDDRSDVRRDADERGDERKHDIGESAADARYGHGLAEDSLGLLRCIGAGLPCSFYLSGRISEVVGAIWNDCRITHRGQA